MPATDDNTSKRFSLVYLTTTDGLADSKRARVRVAEALGKASISNGDLAGKVRDRLGVKIEHGYNSYLVGRFVEHCELRDFLDLISLVAEMLGGAGRTQWWIASCREIFSEERLRYSINDMGAVRFSADASFEQSVRATLSGIGHPAFAGAKVALEASLQCLAQAPPDGKTAVRNVFEAVEIAFKTLCPGQQRIGSAEITKNLVPILNARYEGDETARRVAQSFARSLAEWVNGVHFYRHAQTGTEPVQPPLDLAIALTSQGMGFLRWLAGLAAK